MRGADPLLLDYLALEQAVGFIQIVAIDPIGKLQFLKLVIDLLLLPDAVITVPAIGCLAIGVDALVLELSGELKEAFLV